MKEDMKIAIIDDELHCVESLLITLNYLYPKFKIVYKSTNPLEAVKKLPEIQPDLLFLDVEMPHLNGFELLEQFEKPPFDVIFTTAYSQYAVQAFNAQAVNYLLKPVDDSELEKAIDCWLERRQEADNSTRIDQFLNTLKKEGILTSKIAVPTFDGFEFIEVKDILYCQSQSNYTCFHLLNGVEILISKSLKETEKALEEFFFIRPHQSFIINPNYMKKYVRTDGGYLVMIDGKKIPISNSKKELVVGIFQTVRKDNDKKR